MQIRQFKDPDFGVNKLSKTKPYEKESGGTFSHCGRRNHFLDQCRLKDLSCHECDEKGHIAKVCRYQAKAKWVEVEEDHVGDQCHMIATIGKHKSLALGAEVCDNGSWISMEGSSVNCFRVHV